MEINYAGQAGGFPFLPGSPGTFNDYMVQLYASRFSLGLSGFQQRISITKKKYNQKFMYKYTRMYSQQDNQGLGGRDVILRSGELRPC